MYKLSKLNSNVMARGFSFFALTLLISTFTSSISAKEGMIPIEKLVCYGQ